MRYFAFIIKSVVQFERSLGFMPLLMNLVVCVRIYVKRIVMIVVFLETVRQFVSKRKEEAVEEIGFFIAFQDIFIAIFLVIASLALVDLMIRIIRYRMRVLSEAQIDVSSFDNVFRSRRHYNLVTQFTISVIISSVLIIFFDCEFVLPFFAFGLICAFVFNSTMLSLSHIRGFGIGYLRTQLLDLFTLCAYVLSLCTYFYLYGGQNVDIVGFFVIILVPRVAFDSAKQLLTLS